MNMPAPGTSNRIRLAAALHLLLTVGLLACQDKTAPDDKPSADTQVDTKPAATTTASPTSAPSASPVQKPSKMAHNVLLLTVDSMRADMPWNGYERDIAPNLTALAKKSTVYENAYSVSSYTAKSVSALLASRYPSSIYRSGWFFAEFSEANLFFPEVLQDRGIRTMAGHAHLYFGRGKRLEQGFDEWELVPGIAFHSDTDKNVTSDKLTKLAMDMLAKPENTKGQFFMWLHYMDPHDEYIQHEESPVFGKNNRDRYDAEMFYTDLHIGKLLEFVKSQPYGDNTAVVVSADHGEAFGEHGMFKHAFELWEVLTRVPLNIYVPGLEPRRIAERRSDIDVAPTILELMGVEPLPDSFVGRSLVAELRGEKPDNREPIILDLPEDKNNPDRRAIIQGDYKLLVYGPGDRSFRLFNLKEDPAEEKDLARAEAAKLEEMKKLYQDTFSKLEVVQAYGGMELRSGRKANGPRGPSKDESNSKPDEKN